MKSLPKRAAGATVLAVALALSLGAYGHGQVPSAGKPNKPPAPPSVDHKAFQTRPIQLGTSGGNATDSANGYCCSGTLGALVTDGTIQYILSNTHVFAHDMTAGDADGVAEVDDPINQPGLVDSRCITNEDYVAALSDWVPLEGGGNVDAAIAQVIGDQVDAKGTISATPVIAFPGQNVKKSGRTTGLTTSSVSAINATVTVSYDTECAGSAFPKEFTGQIVVNNRGSKFLAGGDSGSLMVENVAGNPAAVGLLFAGSKSIAVANPIGDVLARLNVRLVGVGVASAEVDQGPPRSEIARAKRAQEHWANVLRKIPRGVGHGIGLEGGRVVVKVFVEEITDEARRALPDNVDGVPVVLEAVGRIIAF